MAKQTDRFLKFLESKGEIPEIKGEEENDLPFDFDQAEMPNDLFEDMQNYFLDKEDSGEAEQDSAVENFSKGGTVAPKGESVNHLANALMKRGFK